MMKRPLYRILATFVFEYEGCKIQGDDAGAARFKARIEEFVRKYMDPDPKVLYKLHLAYSDSQRLVFTMDIRGNTQQLVVKSCLHTGMRLTVGGPKIPDRHYHQAFAALRTLQDEVRV